MRSWLPPTKKYFFIMFLLSCIFLQAFAYVIYQQSKVNKASNEWVIHSYEVLRYGQRILVNAIDINNDEQNYLLTGLPQYLADYNDVLGKLNDHINDLEKATADNTDQQKNVKALTDAIQKLKEISNNSTAAVRHGNVSVYSLKASEKASKQAIADVRAAFDVFARAESSMLDQRTEKAKHEQSNYFFTLMMGTVLGVCALVVANLIIFSLVTRNSRAEEKLKKSEHLFSLIINGLNDGLFDYNVVTGNIFYSASYKSLLGYEVEELNKHHDYFYEIMHPDDLPPAQEIMRQYMAREIPDYCNFFRVRHKDGHWMWLMSRGVGIWDDHGQIQRLIGTHTDITAQKQREEELNFFINQNQIQQAELALAKEKAEVANQAKSDFLATMSHEIRTPMNAVVGLARLLLETPLNSKQIEMAETLRVNADILLRLVNDLLDLSRIESGQFELESHSFSFQDSFKTLQVMFEAQIRNKGLDFIIDNQIPDINFLGDAARIQQILVNLIGNAVKFTQHGSISIIAEAHDENIKEATLVITVSDTGVGIPAEKLSTVFEKFVQADQTIARRFGGSGLGLAICQSLAHFMGGYMSVESTLNKGSNFKLVLPLKKAEIEPAPTAKDNLVNLAPLHSPREYVLIVEDYSPNIMVATMMLEYLGYQAEAARSGAEALEKIQQRTKPYTAILMDVQMQDMDGFETTRQIRELEKEKGFSHFIIGVTAHALAGDRDKCLESGMNEYMSKPIHPDILAEKLTALSKAA